MSSHVALLTSRFEIHSTRRELPSFYQLHFYHCLSVSSSDAENNSEILPRITNQAARSLRISKIVIHQPKPSHD
jgi:hypothetical protein